MNKPKNLPLPPVFACERCGFRTTSGISFDYHKVGCTMRSTLDIREAKVRWQFTPPVPPK